MENTLRKSRDNSIVFGVCGGLSDYFNMDVSLIRLILVLFTLMGGSGILLYIIAAVIMKPA